MNGVREPNSLATNFQNHFKTKNHSKLFPNVNAKNSPFTLFVLQYHTRDIHKNISTITPAPAHPLSSPSQHKYLVSASVDRRQNKETSHHKYDYQPLHRANQIGDTPSPCFQPIRRPWTRLSKNSPVSQFCSLRRR